MRTKTENQITKMTTIYFSCQEIKKRRKEQKQMTTDNNTTTTRIHALHHVEKEMVVHLVR